jgi:uncharacterized protein YbjT (DUF2867 family)
MTILVTGATGQSGQAVLREFARRRVPVRALVRDTANVGGLRELAGVEVVEGDMLRPSSLGPALDGVDRALMISTAGPALVETQCTFVDAAQAAGLKHVVKFSGAESGIGFRHEKFRFTRNHQQAERYLEASGLAWTHLRPSQFMQVYLREARSIVADGVLALPTESITLSPVDIDDIAKVAFALLTTDGHEGRSYPMTGPEALTMTEIAAEISAAIGKPVRYVRITPEQRRADMMAAAVPQDFADAVFDQAVERLAHPESRVSLATHAKFGVQPTTFAAFVQRHRHLFS